MFACVLKWDQNTRKVKKFFLIRQYKTMQLSVQAPFSRNTPTNNEMDEIGLLVIIGEVSCRISARCGNMQT